MAGTDRTQDNVAQGPAVVLVEPQLGENIGAAARAMANFGLVDLRLVAPRDGWPSDKARAVASRADHVLDAAQVYRTLEEAIADLRYVYATTARPRDLSVRVSEPRAAAEHLRRLHRDRVASGILFGRERWGLTNDEVACADAIVTFPVNPAFASLNIAQAVLLVGYEWFRSGLEDVPQSGRGTPMRSEPPATKDELEHLFVHLETELEASGYFRSSDMAPVMRRNLRTILGRAELTGQEVRTLRGVIKALAGKDRPPSVDQET